MLTDARKDMTKLRGDFRDYTDATNNNLQLSDRCDEFHVPTTLSPGKGSIDRPRQRWHPPPPSCYMSCR